MMGDPRDAWAYRFAVGALGLAVTIALAGAIVIAALGEPAAVSPSSTTTETTTTKSRIPGGSKVVTTSKQSTTSSTVPPTTGTPVPATKGTTVSATFSVTPTGLYIVGGALTGALLGILIPSPLRTRLPAEAGCCTSSGTHRDGVTWTLIGLAVALLAVFATTIALGVVERIVSLEVLGAASGAALLGLFVPSPATRR